MEHDALSIRMAIKALIQDARMNPELSGFDFVGEVDEEDVIIEALIHPELFEVKARMKEEYL